MISVAEAFRRFRLTRGLSQQAVAERIGVKQGSYTAYENKGVAPTVDKLRKMACEFNVSTDYLLGLTDDPRPVDEILAEQKKSEPSSDEQTANAIAELKTMLAEQETRLAALESARAIQ